MQRTSSLVGAAPHGLTSWVGAVGDGDADADVDIDGDSDAGAGDGDSTVLETEVAEGC